MGHWDYTLFTNDLAQDIKTEIESKLDSGYEVNEIITLLESKYLDISNNRIESCIFWIVAAYTLWSCGYSQKDIINKANISITEYLGLLDSQNQTYSIVEEELFKIKDNIMKKPIKKRAKILPYVCPWKIGDTYAYLIESDPFEEHSIKGKYIIIRKVKNCNMNKNIFPIVELKITKTQYFPINESEINELDYLQVRRSYEDEDLGKYLPVNDNEDKPYHFDKYGRLPTYSLKIFGNSLQQIPRKLVYLGNFMKIDPPELENHFYDYTFYQAVHWIHFENEVVNFYHYFNFEQ